MKKNVFLRLFSLFLVPRLNLFGVDDAVVGTIIGAGIAAATSAGVNWFNSEEQKRKEKKQRDWNLKAVLLQYLNQQQQQQHAEAMQREQWSREDASYQRTASDMRRAGINPLSMQGVTGSSFSGLSSGSLSVPDMNYQASQLDLSPISQFAQLGLNASDQKHRHRVENQASSDAHGAAMDSHNESLKQQAVLDAQERELLASAADQEYETQWKREHGISAASSNSTYTAIKEIGSDLINVVKNGSAEKIVSNVSETVKNWTDEKKKQFNDSVNSLSQSTYGQDYSSLSVLQKANILRKLAFNKE